MILLRDCRYIAREPAARQEVGGYVRAAFRLPEKLLLSQPKVKMSPALQYLSLLPNRYCFNSSTKDYVTLSLALYDSINVDPWRSKLICTVAIVQLLR